MKILILLIVLGTFYGIALTFWHRKLLSYLRRKSADEWQKLSPALLGDRIWPYSTSLPIWSWKSILFFLMARYKRNGDAEFIRRANHFRLALVIYILFAALVTIAALRWQAHH